MNAKPTWRNKDHAEVCWRIVWFLTKEQSRIALDEGSEVSVAVVAGLRKETFLSWGPAPKPRGFNAIVPSQVDGFGFFLDSGFSEAEDGDHPQPGPAPESALGLRPRIALSSAPVRCSVSQGKNRRPYGRQKTKKTLDQEQRFHIWGRPSFFSGLPAGPCKAGDTQRSPAPPERNWHTNFMTNP